MLWKRLLIFFTIFFFGLYAYNYYQLHGLRLSFKDILANTSNSNLSVNWTQNVASLNQLNIELQHEDQSFILTLKPSYFSENISFEVDQAAESYISSILNTKTTFQKITGYITPDARLMLQGHDITLHDLPLKDAKSIHRTLPTQYFIHAQQGILSLQYEHFNDIFAPSSVRPTLLSLQANKLNVNNSFSIEKFRWDTEDSTLKEMRYDLVIQNLEDQDSKLLSTACKLSIPKHSQLQCDKALLQDVLPASLDLHGKIDNILLQEEPSHGEGYFHLLFTNQVINHQMKGVFTQSPKALDLKAQYDFQVTDKSLYQKVMNLIDPDNTLKHTLRKEHASIQVETDPYTLNPMTVTLGVKSAYEDTHEITTLNVTLDKTKSRYYLSRNTQQDVELKDLEYVGMVNIGHQSLLKAASDFLGFEVTPNTVIDVYQD